MPLTSCCPFPTAVAASETCAFTVASKRSRRKFTKLLDGKKKYHYNLGHTPLKMYLHRLLRVLYLPM